MLKLMTMTFFYAAVAVAATTISGASAAVAAPTSTPPALTPYSNCGPDTPGSLTAHATQFCIYLNAVFPDTAANCTCFNANPTYSPSETYGFCGIYCDNNSHGETTFECNPQGQLLSCTIN